MIGGQRRRVVAALGNMWSSKVGTIMKTQTFTGKSNRDLYKQLFEWKSSRPGAIVKETRIDNLPVDLSRPVVGGAKIPEQDFVSMRIYYEE